MAFNVSRFSFESRTAMAISATYEYGGFLFPFPLAPTTTPPPDGLLALPLPVESDFRAPDEDATAAAAGTVDDEELETEERGELADVEGDDAYS